MMGYNGLVVLLTNGVKSQGGWGNYGGICENKLLTEYLVEASPLKSPVSPSLKRFNCSTCHN